MKKLELKLAHWAGLSLFLAFASLVWDGWWHIAVGRESLWEPPHLFLYAFTMIAVLLGVYGWYTTRYRRWKHFAIILLLVPLSAPLDNFWHELFGAENLSTPLIIWSPPHLVLFGSLIVSFVLLLPLMRRDTVSWQRFLDALAFAAILSIALGITGPVYPFGPYRILSFLGAGIMAAVLISILVTAADWIPEFGGATLTALFFLVLYLVQDAPAPGAQVVIPSFPHIPGWIIAFSTIVPAVVIDTLKHWPIMARGALAGLGYTGILYGFSRYFILGFQYSTQEMLVAIFSGVIGGITVVLILKHRLCLKPN